ncbi:MAG: CsbD family protein [Alphaproteobacteria bacterium]
MNKDQIKGAAKDVAGKAEKAFGDAVKSPEHQIKGMANQVAGKTQKAVGDMKEDADKAHHEVRHEAKKEMKREERKI